MCAFISMAQLLSTPSLAVQQYQSILLTSHSLIHPCFPLKTDLIFFISLHYFYSLFALNTLNSWHRFMVFTLIMSSFRVFHYTVHTTTFFLQATLSSTVLNIHSSSIIKSSFPFIVQVSVRAGGPNISISTNPWSIKPILVLNVVIKQSIIKMLCMQLWIFSKYNLVADFGFKIAYLIKMTFTYSAILFIYLCT